MPREINEAAAKNAYPQLYPALETLKEQLEQFLDPDLRAKFKSGNHENQLIDDSLEYVDIMMAAAGCTRTTILGVRIGQPIVHYFILDENNDTKTVTDFSHRMSELPITTEVGYKLARIFLDFLYPNHSFYLLG